MKFEITSRWNSSILFSLETDSLKLAVEAGVKSGADLGGADLGGANLRGADLREADLREADLRGANLRGADLGGADLGVANLRGANLGGANLRDADLGGADLGVANLRGADLRGADLRGANLGGANLRGAILRGADLREAILRGANLRGANLREAILRGADLTVIRDDLWAVLSAAPAEVIGLRTAIVGGRIDGSTYEGACACLVGTLAKVRGCKYNAIPGLVPNSIRPAEMFFATIKPGETPGISPNAKLALKWIDTWLDNMRSAFVVTTP